MSIATLGLTSSTVARLCTEVTDYKAAFSLRLSRPMTLRMSGWESRAVSVGQLSAMISMECIDNYVFSRTNNSSLL